MDIQTMTKPCWTPRLIATLVLALTVFGATQAAAQSRWYTIEIAIFERTADAGLGQEYWPENTGSAERGFALSSSTDTGVRVLTAGSSEASAIARLGPGQLAYGGMVKRLTSSGRFRKLVHTGWRQPGLEKSEALPVRVNGSASGGVGSAVTGTVRMYRARYLHLEANLSYSRDGTASSTRFSLRESRRMRSGELHYLDHPLFGVLVRATPYQAPGGEYVPARQSTPAEPTKPTPKPAGPAS
jgi:hypothetical protein